MIIYDCGEPSLPKLRRQIVHAKREDVEQAAEQIDVGESASAKARNSNPVRLAPACERGPATSVEGRSPEVESNGIGRPDCEASENGKHPDPEAHRSHNCTPAVPYRGLDQDAVTTLINGEYRSFKVRP
jgi:hypothetical protein